MTIHPLADVQAHSIGQNTLIWQFSVVLGGAVIGQDCNINCHTFIENDVVIGNNVTIKPGVFIWDGITIEDNVFVGPNATFTNDKYPRSKQRPDSFQKTILKHNCSIGANATVLGGVIIGEFSIIAAGSVVTKDVPPFSLVKGNPAKVCAMVNEKGEKVSLI